MIHAYDFRSTGELEIFNNLILMYASKRHSYRTPAYRVKNLLAALDHNSHVERPVILNQNGNIRCECESSSTMDTADECICCQVISAVSINMEDSDISCITEHDIFVANCLNRHVLHISMLEYLENVGPLDDNEPINEKYQFMAYSRFVQWVRRRLGRNNKILLTSMCSYEN